MSKFDEKIENVINEKAKRLEEQFWTEFSAFLNKWRLSDSVKFDGLKYYQPKDAKSDEWRKKVTEIMVGIETDKFLNEISRLHDYFEGR